jgi:hypothetical protein
MGYRPGNVQRCSTCNAEIYWVTMEVKPGEKPKRMPIDVPPAGFKKSLVIDPHNGKGAMRYCGRSVVSHFATCPGAKAHRGSPRKKKVKCGSCNGAGDWEGCRDCDGTGLVEVRA